jgi:crotonobetainyl-CoA:carnitine CoA-transferase CaiB-like acyl-CoA transferase
MMVEPVTAQSDDRDEAEHCNAFGALSDLKIIDLTQILAGPFATQMLADQGAEVIKIEPLGGEFYRHDMPFREDDREHRYSGYFTSVNRNKKSVAIDLRTPEGTEIVLRLVRDADAFVENFREGVTERLGLSFERLKRVNPKLVYASIRGFGDSATAESPLHAWPAFDIVAQAMGGMMSCTGPDADTPLKVGPSIGDVVPGIFCAFGILAAVHNARRTGIGQYVDVALADSMLAISERVIHQFTVEGRIAVPEGNHHPAMCPYGAFPASDGWIALACPNDDFWMSMCRALDADAVRADPRYATRTSRLLHRMALQDDLAAITGRFTKQELSDRLGGKVPFGPVLNAAEIVQHPHFRAREMIVPVDYGLSQPFYTVGVPVRLSETPGRINRRAPDLGQDTDAVLAASAFSTAEIDQYRKAGVIN